MASTVSHWKRKQSNNTIIESSSSSFQLPPHATGRLFASHQGALAAATRAAKIGDEQPQLRKLSSTMMPSSSSSSKAGKIIPTPTLSYTITQDTTHGSVLVARSLINGGVSAILVGRRREELEEDLRRRFPKYKLVAQGTKEEGGGHGEDDAAICKYLEEGFATSTPSEEPKLHLIGTPFQRIVWKALLEIPSGSTETYQQLTNRAKLPPTSVRAVANACGQNHVAILVPCHRVVRSDGGMGGYHWGVEMKKKILGKEKRNKGG